MGRGKWMGRRIQMGAVWGISTRRGEMAYSSKGVDTKDGGVGLEMGGTIQFTNYSLKLDLKNSIYRPFTVLVTMVT